MAAGLDAVPDSRSSAQVSSSNMQVQRPIDDAVRPFPLVREPRRVAVAPVMALSKYPRAVKMTPSEEVHVDMHAAAVHVPHCGVCGVAVRQSDTSKKFGDALCQGCRRSRKASWEDVRPASPMAGKPRVIDIEKKSTKSRPLKPADRRVHPDGNKWTVVKEVESEPETSEDSGLWCGSFRVKESPNTGSFRTMEVLTCFRAEASRGLRLVLKLMTAERWHAWWAILLSLLLWPILVTLAVVAGVGFLVLSTWVAIACAVVYPLAYLNPKLYDYAMDS